MQEHYSKGKQISEAQCTLLDSGTWKWIIQSKTNALHMLCKKVGNGQESQDTYIWLDSWLPMGKLLGHVDRAPSRTAKWMVSEIVVDGGSARRDPELLPIWHLILQHTVPDISVDDSWYWTLTKTSTFSFSSAWEHVRHRCRIPIL